jgi:hypothetical protein
MDDPPIGGGRDLAPHADRASLELPALTASVPEARHFVTRSLPETCWADEVTLLVSELASNAVRHAGTPFSVSLECDGATVRVAVSDGEPALPVLQRPPVDAITGRGLLIVDALATRWGVDPGATGKTVWFELACRSTADADSA